MTRLIIIISLFLAMLAGASFTAAANDNHSTAVTENIAKETKSDSHADQASTKSAAHSGVSKQVPPAHPEEKHHSPKLNELPHIHHFHKERVKKIKRHHKKVWSFSVVLLVICHISILIMSYMHVTPH